MGICICCRCGGHLGFKIIPYYTYLNIGMLYAFSIFMLVVYADY